MCRWTPPVPGPATHTHALGRHHAPTWLVRQRKPTSRHGCACMCTARALPCAHLPMPAAGEPAHQAGWDSTVRDPWCPPRPGGTLQHCWAPPRPLPLPLRRLFVPRAPCQKLGTFGVRRAKKWAARARLVLLNHEELAAELGALNQAHLALRVRGAAPLAHHAVPCWLPRLMRFQYVGRIRPQFG